MLERLLDVTMSLLVMDARTCTGQASLVRAYASGHVRFERQQLLMGLAEVRIRLALRHPQTRAGSGASHETTLVASRMRTASMRPGGAGLTSAGTGLEAVNRLVELVNRLDSMTVVVVIRLVEPSDNRVE